MLALGSRPNDFAIAGLAQRALSLYSASDAKRVWESVSTALTAAAAASDPRAAATRASVCRRQCDPGRAAEYGSHLSLRGCSSR